MESFVTRLKRLGSALGLHRVRDAANTLRERLYSDWESVGLRRDLSVPMRAPDAAMALTVAPDADGAAGRLLDTDLPGLTGEGRYLRAARREILDSGIPTCFVARTDDGVPVYLQWLIGPEDNARLKSVFRGIFPALQPDELLLEGAFTPESMRGKRIMPAAMARIAEMGASRGARWVVTFVACDNTASLKGCERAGFRPYLRRTERWRLFHRTLRFEALPHSPVRVATPATTQAVA